MPNHPIPINSNIQTPRRRHPHRPRAKQPPLPRIRPRDLITSSILHVVARRLIALRREEEDVLPAHIRQRRRLNIRPVGGDIRENLHGVSDLRVSVLSDLLQHNRRGHDGLDGIPAAAAVSDRVAVVLVHHVPRAGGLLVREARDVDGAACSRRTDPGDGGAVDEGVGDGFRGGVREAVEVGVRFQRGRVVHYEAGTRLDDVRGPDAWVGVGPGWEGGEGVDAGAELEGLPVGGVGSLDVDEFFVDDGVGGEEVPAVVGSDH